MGQSSFISNIYRSDILPPTHVDKKTKDSDKWKKAMLDSFENEAVKQFSENLEFYDYYRMVDNDMSYQELSDVIPQLQDLEQLLDGVGIPTNIKHYDLLGLIIRVIVGKYIDLQNKFYVSDTGEVAENEFLRFKNDKINDAIQAIIDNRVKFGLAKKGLSPEGKQFNSQEEQQQFMQQLEQAKAGLIPQDLDREIKTTFKSKGRSWGEATLNKDREVFNLLYLEKEELKDKLISGRYFREYVITNDSYSPNTWSPKNTFFSKETNSLLPQKGEYVGRITPMTPAEVEARFGHELDVKTVRTLLGGNPNWKNGPGNGYTPFSGGTIKGNFNTIARVPFSNFYEYENSLDFEDMTDQPLGLYTDFKSGGTTPRFLPRFSGANNGRYNTYAKVLRDDFTHRNDLCQVTEVYFRAYDLIGYLTYENEFGATTTSLVTEDILDEFIKENNITVTLNKSRVDIVKNFELNTLQWVYKPVCYEGVKINAPNMEDPIYLYCRPMEFQIRGDSDFEILLPVGGYIGKSFAKKVAPYQAGFNLCMNQITNLVEKEIGMFFLFDVNLIPSEYQNYGDATDAIIKVRELAKEIGIMPVTTAGDTQKEQTHFNQFSTHDVSFTGQIQNRIQLSEFYKNKAYEAVGVTPQMMAQPTKYETASGAKISQDASFAQISEIYEDYEIGNKGMLELHLSIAQFCQATGKDNSMMYTKSDSSIEFLKFNDPLLPLRRLGIIPVVNSKKRKELEEFKQYLLQTNTLGADTLEIARLISSDVMSEALEIARIERERREQQDELKHQRDLEIQQQQAQIEQQKEGENWQRTEESKEKDRQARKDIEYIKAVGIASDKNNPGTSYDELEKVRNEGRQQANINQQYENDAKEFNLKERKTNEMIDLEKQKLMLKAEDIKNKKAEIASKIYTSEINKN